MAKWFLLWFKDLISLWEALNPVRETVYSTLNSHKNTILDFPGGAVNKNPLAKAGAQVWSLVLEDSTYYEGTKSHMPQPLSLSSGAHEPRLRKPVPGAWVLQQEKPPLSEDSASQQRLSSSHRN